MPHLLQPFYLVSSLNRDFAEEIHLVRTQRDVALKTAEIMEIGINPLVGVTADFWEHVEATYVADGWRGLAAFRIEGPAAGMTPMENPLISSQEMGIAVIDAPLSGNPEGPLYAVLMNRDFVESAAVFEDPAEVTPFLMETFSIDPRSIENAEDLDRAITASYAAGGWRGLVVARIDPRSLEHSLLDPSDAGLLALCKERSGTPAPV